MTPTNTDPTAQQTSTDILDALESCVWVLANLAPVMEEAKRRGIYFGCNPEEALAKGRAAIAKAKAVRP